MRKLFLSLGMVLFFFNTMDPQERGHPIPPGVREADKRTIAADEPPLPPKPKPRNPGQLQEDAEELARLSAAIPAQIRQIKQGQMPKDLNDQLKRIEKLAKHLRSEIMP